MSSAARLKEMDALRGIGALLVVGFHYTTRFHELFPKAPHVPFNIGGGDYRVLLFFAISGFAIFFSLRRLTSGWDFIANRAVRLLPAYWAAMALTLVIEHLGHMTMLYIPPFAALMNVTMLQGFFFLPAVDGAYWTLTVEVAFYLCIISLWQLCRMRPVEHILLGWLLLKLVFELIWVDMPERIVMLLILRYIPFFGIGMACYRVWAGERSWWQQGPILAAIVVSIAVSNTWDFLAVALLILIVFYAMVEGRMRWLCVTPLIWVGQISYSLYLVHQHIGFTIMLNAEAAGLSPLAAFALAIFAAFALGYLVNRCVERPTTAWFMGRWQRFRARPRRRAAAELG
jgi:peptidoglycan/LPS O-acetylase OafA/YrhL